MRRRLIPTWSPACGKSCLHTPAGCLIENPLRPRQSNVETMPWSSASSVSSWSSRMPWSAERYTELEEEALVLTPLHSTTVLLPEHFSTPLSQLRYPVKLDFSHERFRLRSLALLTQLKDTALQEIDLSDNELQSLAELSRFSALKTLCAAQLFVFGAGRAPCRPSSDAARRWR